MTYGRPSSVRNDSIYVIQSLRPEDTETGSTLYYSVIAPKAGNRSVGFRAPTTKQEFMDVFEGIRDELLIRRQMGRVSAPIIHIEVHGGTRGIQLGNDEYVSWDELKVVLQRINVISQMNTLVMLSACKGVHVAKAIQPHERSPAFAVFGPDNEPDANDLLDDLCSFYDVFLGTDTSDFEQAWKKLEESQRVSWKRHTANEVFRFVYSKFATEWNNPENNEERIDAMMSYLAPMAGDKDMCELERQVREQVENVELHFDVVKNPFYMIDLFPENATRFPITHDDIVEPMNLT